jgi:hypothetical protein
MTLNTVLDLENICAVLLNDNMKPSYQTSLLKTSHDYRPSFDYPIGHIRRARKGCFCKHQEAH